MSNMGSTFKNRGKNARKQRVIEQKTLDEIIDKISFSYPKDGDFTHVPHSPLPKQKDTAGGGVGDGSALSSIATSKSGNVVEANQLSGAKRKSSKQPATNKRRQRL